MADILWCDCKRRGPVHVWEPGESCNPTRVPYRPRVAFTPGSIAKTVTARRRYVCGNHLTDEKHYIEPGQRYVHNSLPPHNSDIGNQEWWHLRVCLDCCPIEHDERKKGTDRG